MRTDTPWAVAPAIISHRLHRRRLRRSAVGQHAGRARQIVLVVSPDHPWAERAVAPADLAGAEWVMREPGSGTRSALEAGLQRFGISASQLRAVLELPSNETVRAAVESGMGATAISASVAAPSLEAGLLHHVPLDLPEREFRAIWHRDRHQSRAARELLALTSAAGEPTSALPARAGASR